MPDLPETISAAAFAREAGQTGPLQQALLAAVATLARHHHLVGEIMPLPGGSNFVASVGPWNVVKLFPPFQRFQWEAELKVLKALMPQRLPVALPQFRAGGELGAWGYVAMARLAGSPLDEIWPRLAEFERRELLSQIGGLMRAVHTLPAQAVPSLDPPWELFWTHQRERCPERLRRLGLPPQLLADLPAWLEAWVPELAALGPRVLLTGEYTPENLLLRQEADGWRLCGMFDFADAMLGPARYDWLGPLCFLVQGQRPRLDAFLQGYGQPPGDEAALRREQLAYLLLHRYSDPEVQIQIPGWRDCADLEALSQLLWPAKAG